MRRPILVLLFILYSTCALSYSCDLTSLTTLDSVKYDQCGQSIQASTKVGKTMPDWISLLGGILGIVGGMSGLYAAWRPVKLSVDHLDHMCVVYHNNGTTPAIHLPVVITNGTRKPGVITLLALSIKGDKTAEPIVCNWDQFWTEDNVGDRVFERRPSPIPVPGFASVERNVQFSVPESWKWKPDVYKICFDIRVGRKRGKRSLYYFFVKPSEKQIINWYSKHNETFIRLDPIPLFKDKQELIESQKSVV